MRAIAFALAAGVPVACYVATLSSGSYWLDAGEFVAAAFQLDISHPPGHPLSGLYGKAWSFLPLGSLAERVAFGQAFAAAFAAAFLCRAIETTVRCVGVRSATAAMAIALCGTWLAALSYGWWFQAVRPEVYALQTFLVCVALERLVAFEARRVPDHESEAPGDVATLTEGAAGRSGFATSLLVAAIALGLGLTNHHFVAVLVMPAFLWTVLRAVRRRGARLFWNAAAAGVLAVCTYVYLPARAATQPPANLGDPTTLARVWWVVTGRVYARHQGMDSWQPMDERFMDMAVIIAEHFYVVFALLAMAGWYVLVRREATRSLGVLWGLVAAVDFGARAWLDPVRGNPDALGYLGPGFAATAALCAAFLGVVCTAGEGHRSASRWLPPAFAVLAVGIVAMQITHVGPRASLAAFHATDAFGDARVAALPPRAIVIATTPQWVFRHWEQEATDSVRPDVVLVPLPFLAYPGTADAFIARHPDLGELVRSHVANDHLQAAPLLRLAARRPVLVELDMRIEPDLYAYLVPDGLFHAVHAPDAAPAMEVAAASQRAAYARLYGVVGADAHERETSRQLLWMHYLDAVHYAARGARALAREAADRGAALHPADARLAALRSALVDADDGPLDVRRFLEQESRSGAP